MTSHKENHINILQIQLAFIKKLLSPQNHYYSMIASAFGIFTFYKLHIHLFRSFYMAHMHSEWDNDRGTRHSCIQNRWGRRPRRFRFTDDEFRGHYAT